MASILLSFVGNQDPGSSITNTEGSIVALTRHLLAQRFKIKAIILLYTSGTEDAANFTKEWLLSDELEQFSIPPDQIELMAVDKRLSQDPVDLLLATEAAKKAISQAQLQLESGDRLEFNTSSGTPAMKCAWSIIQASGLAPQSHLWAVRNPDKMLPDQERIFESDLTIFKKTIDRQTLKKQIACHNYYGALATFEASSLIDNGVSTLLKCAAYRLSSAFEDSFNQIKNHVQSCGETFHNQSNKLARREHREIIREIYFQAKIKGNNQEYSDLLIKIFVFQESVLFYLLKRGLLSREKINLPMSDQLKSQLDREIANYDNGDLKQYLNNYTLRDGRQLILNSGYNRTVMTAVVEYLYQQTPEICMLLTGLDGYCQQRNNYIHQLQGITNLQPVEIISNIKQILELLEIPIKPNPFKEINSKINDLLDIQL